jgi:hypothetical protein
MCVVNPVAPANTKVLTQTNDQESRAGAFLSLCHLTKDCIRLRRSFSFSVVDLNCYSGMVIYRIANGLVGDSAPLTRRTNTAASLNWLILAPPRHLNDSALYKRSWSSETSLGTASCTTAMITATNLTTLDNCATDTNLGAWNASP